MKLVYLILIASTYCGTIIADWKCFPDVAIVIQTSDAIPVSTLQQTVAVMVSEIAEQLSIMPTQTNLAVVHFSQSSNTGISFNLNSKDTYTTAKLKLDALFVNVPNLRGISDLDLGLKVCNNLVFIAGQDRTNVPNVMLLFADGNFNSSTASPFVTAAQLRSKVPLLYAVPIGTANFIDLSAIVGQQTDRILSKMTSAQIIAKIQSDLAPICPAVITTTPTLPPVTSPTTTTTAIFTTTVTPVCQCACMDIVLIISSAQSVTQDHFVRLRTFAAALTQLFEVGPLQVRVALIAFSDDAYFTADFKQYNTTVEISQAIFNLVFTPGLSNSEAAFVKAQTYLSTQARPNVPKVIYYLGSGKHTGGPDPVPIATQLRTQLMTTIISVGVPGVFPLNEADKTELRQISGCTNPLDCPQAKILDDVKQLSDNVRPVRDITPCLCQQCPL